MAKSENRIRSLVKRTHNFLSYEDLCLIRDYFEARFKESDQPLDLESRLEEVEFLLKERDLENDVDAKSRIDELIRGSDAVRYKGLFEWMTSMCKYAPNGTWLPALINYTYPLLVAEARTYFAQTKERD